MPCMIQRLWSRWHVKTHQLLTASLRGSGSEAGPPLELQYGYVAWLSPNHPASGRHPTSVALENFPAKKSQLKMVPIPPALQPVRTALSAFAAPYFVLMSSMTASMMLWP